MVWQCAVPWLFDPVHVNQMSDPNQPPSLDELGNRISKARRTAGLERSEEEERAYGSGLGAAWRISVELVVAVVVCAAIGYGVDHVFGTKPWAMIVMLFLGAGAGINNAVRTAMRMDRQATEALAKKSRAHSKRERGD